jgi:anti-sigma regulatory factor (Ser/Thr protein kinase)/predicted transcriptional regulator
MVREVIQVTPSTPMGELRAILRDNRISGTPVVDGRGHVVGIISVEDFIRWLADGGPDCRIADRMTRDVITIYEDEPLIGAVNKLERFGFGRLLVLSRADDRLRGIITNGDIIAGLLKKLDIDYRRAELRSARSKHIFEDIVADRSELTFQYQVAGGDLDRAGGSASGLKTTLLRLGISPPVARRAAIAAYEAEMNLIFFAGGGEILARIAPRTIRLEVVDEGPGIADVPQAMRPGFSTAPDWVRELGFGAGMGLHNIKTCADRMNLTSTVGKGTRLEVEISVEPEREPGRADAETGA